MGSGERGEGRGEWRQGSGERGGGWERGEGSSMDLQSSFISYKLICANHLPHTPLMTKLLLQRKITELQRKSSIGLEPAGASTELQRKSSTELQRKSSIGLEPALNRRGQVAGNPPSIVLACSSRGGSAKDELEQQRWVTAIKELRVEMLLARASSKDSNDSAGKRGSVEACSAALKGIRTRRALTDAELETLR